MITYTEILDSAVKIGLGAAISAVSTYFATKLKSERDQFAEISKHKRDLLERISLASQRSATAITKAVLIVQGLDKIPRDKRGETLLEAELIYQTVFDEHNVAEGLAALLGSPDLSRELTTYGDMALELFNLIRYRPSDTDLQSDVIDKINTSRVNLFAALTAVYDGTAAQHIVRRERRERVSQLDSSGDA